MRSFREGLVFPIFHDTDNFLDASAEQFEVLADRRSIAKQQMRKRGVNHRNLGSVGAVMPTDVPAGEQTGSRCGEVSRGNGEHVGVEALV